jgi:putative transcriptional regulator
MPALDAGGGADYNAVVVQQDANLTHHFLIAMPAMADPNFSRTLTYICEHNEQGALGIVINRPLDMTLEALFERIDIPMEEKRFAALPVMFGGPVQTDRGFVLHRPVGNWQATLPVRGELGLTSSRDILQSVGSAGEPDEFIVSLGYAGWAAGQLEHELVQNAWLTVAADARIIFGLPPEERLPAAMQLLGFDLANLSDVAGHA